MGPINGNLTALGYCFHFFFSGVKMSFCRELEVVALGSLSVLFVIRKEFRSKLMDKWRVGRQSDMEIDIKNKDR